MPTGYTACVKEGVSFQEFALGCARAFGACVTLRDDPNAPIPDRFQVTSDYHITSLIRAGKELQRIIEIQGDIDAIEAELEAKFAESCEYHKERCIETLDLRDKYEQLIIETEAWTPPTEEHIKFKEFMLQQLRESLQFDCSISDRPERMTAESYVEMLWEQVLRDFEYHSKEHKKAIENAKKSTEWVSALRDSLKEETVG